MEITGRLLLVPELKKGVSARGEWKKQEFVLETVDGAFPRKICMTLWNDKTSDIGSFNIGDMLTVSVDIASREFNGSWYTDITAWRVQRGLPPASTAAAAPTTVAAATPATPAIPATAPASEDYSVGETQQDDDLPF
ncbi:MAG: DUF3127 domain-containing protein [Prevotellaceae bacterium]|jgi:hypothetical protein|nr:DUF3127 domain-containing protein [Prevotellaceae bacterium]